MRKKGKKTVYIAVDSHNCRACWECYKACPKQVFGKIDVFGLGIHKHIYVKNPADCIGCNKCVKACQHGAITAVSS